MTKEMEHIFYRDWRKTYPVVQGGEGVYLSDINGKKYLDFSGGPCVVSIGHGVGEVIDAMIEQARKVCFPYHGHFTSEAQIELAKEVIDFAPPGMSKVNVTCGGSEAIENALKFVRQYHIERGEPSRWRVISRRQSYHGSTMAAYSLSGRPLSRLDYIPYMFNFPFIEHPNCYRCPFGKEYPKCGVHCAYDLERIIKLEVERSIAAFIAEPISGNTLGAVVPPPEYFPIIREICDRYGILLVLDEVITGFGRTGKNFAINHWGVVPDLIVSGKGMSSGYAPMGAVILHEKVCDVFSKSNRSTFAMGYTYSYHPVSCAVGLAVLRHMKKKGLVERSARMGEYLFKRFSKLKELPMIGDIRGKGLLMGIELVKDKEKKIPFERSRRINETITKKAFERGLIIASLYGTADGILGDHLTISPPFIINEEQIEEAADLLEKVILEVHTSTDH